MPGEVFKFKDSIDTDYSGYKQMAALYNFCLNYVNQIISLDFYECRWIDANLCALLEAILHKLSKDQGLQFSTDMAFLRQRFDVLFRNGFLIDGNIAEDVQKSTLPTKSFDCADKEGFCDYLKKHLMLHRGMPDLTEEVKDRIMEDLLEVFCNTHHHANTSEPFFVAGQYYPKNSFLKFTMVDLGDGFLPRINRATNGIITTHLDSINWALAGNSSKLILDNTPGNLGIRSMLQYCESTNGQLQIISGDGFWASDYSNTVFKSGRIINEPFMGTTINLFFKK